MREIKFRGWDEVTKEMHYPKTDMMWDVAHIIKSYEPIMQYAGIEDRFGKKIYEGDVVNFAVKKMICPDCAKKECSSELSYGISRFCPECGKPLTNTDFITTSQVVFDKGGFAYKWSSEESYYQSWQTHVAEIYLEWVEIIGNIYENESLLINSKTILQP